MLRLFRARAWCLITAIALAAGTTTAAFGELLHAGASHDAGCAPTAASAHDASSHRVTSPADEGSAHDHCVGCHFARSLRIGAQSVIHGEHVDETRSLRPVAAIGSARAAALDSLPPRSPPRLS
jgi:hypothetical protein